MASPAWLPQEMQSSSSQTSVMSSAAGEPTTSSSTPHADSTQEAAQGKFIPPPGYNAGRASFSYMNASVPSGSSQQSSSSPVISSTSSGSSASPQPPIPGQSANVGSSFSYNISQTDNNFSSGPQFSSSTLRPVAPDHAGDVKNASPAASLQPPLPLASTRLSSFIPGNAAPAAPRLSGSNISFNGSPQMVRTDQTMKPLQNRRVDVAQEMGAMTSATFIMQSVTQAGHMSSGSSATAFPTSHMGSPNIRMPHTPQYQVPAGVPRSPVTPGAPGLGLAMPSSSNVTATASPGGPSLPLRPNVSPGHVLANPSVQQHTYSPYLSPTPMAPSHQGPWLPPPPVTSMLRPPFPSYPAGFAVPFPLSATGAPLSSVTSPDTRPPGVAPVAAPPGVPITASQPNHASGLQPELPPGVDSGKHVNDADTKEGASTSEQLETWTAHRTETGAIYYYNSLTGESTYEKPVGFRGEPGKVAAQPTPVSWEKLAGTDWALVATNDGQKYYYNTKTKLSSWQIPNEVTELKKKHDADALQAQSTSTPNENESTEKGSAPISLSIPAVSTGGRDATTLRPSMVPGSSALDLVKKKLMDSGALPAVSSPAPASSGVISSEVNGSKALASTTTGPQKENSKEKSKEANDNGNMSESSSDSEDDESVPTKEDCIIQFKEMLKERGIAPFSKWEKELPKIVFDPRFKAIPSYSARKALFEHYVKTRADEERKEKRAAQKAAVEGFKQLLEEAKEDINADTNYQSFKKKWGHDPRFESLDRKEREVLLNERVLQLRKAAQEKAHAVRAAAVSQFKSMLREQGDITLNTRWSKVKDGLRNDPRYKSVKHEDREALFNEYISELKAAEQEVARIAKAKHDEEDKLKERERALRKRKEREEQEVERVRLKARRKEAVESYQALLVEVIKDPQASWTESKPKLEKDPQGRAANPHLDQSELEKLFREHVKILYERCAQEFKTLLAEVITVEACSRETEDGKTVANSWSTAKQLLKADPRYSRMARKDRESLWRRYVEDIQRRQKSTLDEGDKARSKGSSDSRRR
ncbi:pre-mRNA-processing protein 40C isoform X1 [Lycium ferocissimum]|uniref:pre-mRNA-processing protein 40C isoform X1 n=1 Tax=Lycium ferocissimum TaxID=112874 RepID=UPI0028162B32|nr:pre-mRNA-processing protein 40C isoform X1 [Lycium ferocissimum]XP_059308906.1 pre-mRNA-processing protein 40C isoform X1 [Lycium ferocissimum]XP_059308907.1 pre-mRNA-processing protein 40C isoform X1 [Lycium ferocissimum]XP_059308908.1 pre-mRNA-processing protein 40C isoform X1 [Lycium ferocissimum]